MPRRSSRDLRPRPAMEPHTLFEGAAWAIFQIGMPDLTIYAIPGFIGLMILEAVIASRYFTLTAYKNSSDTAASLAMGVGSVIINLFWKSVEFAVYSFVFSFALFDLDYGLATWIALIVCEDFCYYWYHRSSHEIRLLWAAHVNHHSSREYNLSTALRQSWTTFPVGMLFWMPLAFVGFDPKMILTAKAISLLYQFWIHTETIGKLGSIEWVMNTPSHHRVHHATNVQYLDRNHAGIFIVWDRWFGSFEPEVEKPIYGLTKNIETYNPLRIAFHEWYAMLGDVFRAEAWSNKFGYLLRPPGWSPDGSTLTADQMRAKWMQQKTGGA